MPQSPSRKPWHRIVELLFTPFGRVKAVEAGTVALLAVTVFLLLTAYYILKVVREPLILANGGAEVKSYSAAGQAVLLILAIRGYDWLAGRFDRAKLIGAINVFFVVNLLIFYLLGQLGVPLGIPFFLWVGIFNVMVVAQFWAFTNDIYSEEQGRRLIAIVAIGGSLGAIAGAQIAGWLIAPLGTMRLMLIAAGVLLSCLLLMIVVHRRERGRILELDEQTETVGPIGGSSTFKLFANDRYLLLVALMTLLFNWVNTTGEYILDRTLLEVASDTAAGAGSLGEFIGVFRARFFFWVNLTGFLLQSFVASRLIEHLGVRVALFIMPLVSLGGYSAMALAPSLAVIALAKGAENSIGYSLQNTARHALFLITSREAKYKAKTTVDTLVWRAGDVLAAGLVWVGSLLAMSTTQFILVNLVLTCCWLAAVILLVQAHLKRTNELHERSGSWRFALVQGQQGAGGG